MRPGLIFLLPLALSVVGTGYFLWFTEADRKWKLLALVLTGSSLGMQVAPDRIPFFIPLILQTLISIWVVVYWKLDG